jgi:putative redox protein
MAANTEDVHGPVTATLDGAGLTTTVTASTHSLIADEPASLGGDDRGPTPYDLLLASLGACKAITLRMYAQRKGWPLDAVDVTLTHGRIHAEDCADCESTSGLVDRIDVSLRLRGDLTPEQRQRLAQIADRCPVHQILTTETVVRTSLD